MDVTPTIGYGAIASLIATIGTTITMVAQIRSWGLKTTDRIKMIEDKVALFLTYDQIEARFNHARDSRAQVEAILDRRITEVDREVVTVKLDVATVKQEQINIGEILTDIKQLMRDVVKDNKDGIKEIQAQLSQISKKVQ